MMFNCGDDVPVIDEISLNSITLPINNRVLLKTYKMREDMKRKQKLPFCIIFYLRRQKLIPVKENEPNPSTIGAEGYKNG